MSGPAIFFVVWNVQRLRCRLFGHRPAEPTRFIRANPDRRWTAPMFVYAGGWTMACPRCGKEKR